MCCLVFTVAYRFHALPYFQLTPKRSNYTTMKMENDPDVEIYCPQHSSICFEQKSSQSSGSRHQSRFLCIEMGSTVQSCRRWKQSILLNIDDQIVSVSVVKVNIYKKEQNGLNGVVVPSSQLSQREVDWPLERLISSVVLVTDLWKGMSSV